METVHPFVILEAGFRYSANDFGTFSFNLDLTHDIRRPHAYRLAVKQFRHISNNFGTDVFQQFADVLR